MWNNCVNAQKDDDGLYSTLNEKDFLRFNVSGMMYETLESTLEKFPATLLGDKQRRQNYYIKSKNAYFFDRGRQSFEAILNYYQTGGRLNRPPGIPMDSFEDEVSFFELGEDVLQRLNEDEGILNFEAPLDRNLPQSYWQRKAWELFEYPDSSLPARILALWSIFVITLSITVFCMETMPVFQGDIHVKHLDIMKKTNKSLAANADETDTSYEQPWFSLELGCIIWFSIEYTIRLMSSPSKCRFMKSILNIIDLAAILPYFIMFSINSGGNTTPLSVLRVVRLVRVFRVFKLCRHSMGLQILGHTFKASISELGMLMFFLVLGIILFSSALFYAEHVNTETPHGSEEGSTFSSIPDAFWYSLVTMTTVGYGDKVPKTLVGKLIGGLCAITGVLAISLPVPVIVSNFAFFYKQNRTMRKKLVESSDTEDERRDEENKDTTKLNNRL